MTGKDREKLLQVYSALIIGFVCVVIGLPLWWLTTNVYRANLPYGSIEDLDKSEPNILVKSEIVIFQSDSSTSAFLDMLYSYLNDIDGSFSFIHTEYQFNVRNINNEENAIFSDKTLQSYSDVEKQFNLINGNSLARGQYRFYIVPSSIANEYFTKNKNAVLGVTRNILIRQSPIEELSQEIIKILRNVLVREHDLSEAYLATKRVEHARPNKDDMRSLKSSLGYDLIFTIMNPQPDIISVHWDMENVGEKFLNPVVTLLSNYAKINIRSQYLHLTGINIQPEYSSKCQCFILPMPKLPHIINPIEPYLASHVTNNPTLNFVVYVPTREQSPLVIFDHEGNPSVTNAFLVPRWGGLMIHNIDTTSTQTNYTQKKVHFEAEIDHKKMFSIFLAQLKTLLGFRKVNDDSIQNFGSTSRIITDWELDAWLLERSVENIGKTASTLQSLSLLLSHISNIVINDDVAQQVNLSIVALEKSLDLLARSQLENAFMNSRDALNSSETAFFDPSLLELLYFPEDQKFAIYIPLFLPIGIPVLNSIYQAINYLVKRQRNPLVIE